MILKGKEKNIIPVSKLARTRLQPCALRGKPQDLKTSSGKGIGMGRRGGGAVVYSFTFPVTSPPPRVVLSPKSPTKLLVIQA